MLNVWRRLCLNHKKWRLPVALLFGDSRHRVYIDYRASPFSRVRVKLALNRLVSVPLSYCAPSIRGRGRGRLVLFSWVDSCMKHTTYHGIISNYNKSSIVQVINRV